MNYLLDTNVLLHYLRATPLKEIIDTRYQPFALENEAIICVVSIGELLSLSLRNQWGEKKIQTLTYLLSLFVVADIHAEDILERYAEIDAFSQGKHPTLKSNFSARNMGKNDLWIAATASVLSATLLTLDRDFDHLDGVFLKIEMIMPQ